MNHFRAAAILTLALFLFSCQTTVPSRIQKLDDGITIGTSNGLVRLEVVSDRIIRVMAATERGFFDRKTLATEPKRTDAVQWKLSRRDGKTIVRTNQLEARVDEQTGAVAFFDASGKPILNERSRTIEPATVQGEQTHHIRQTWTANDDESLYGLGQHQLGLMDIKGYDIDLWQHNGTIAIPMLVSSRGYGIFWDNTSFTRFGELREPRPLQASDGFSVSYFGDPQFRQLVATRNEPTIHVPRPEHGSRTDNTRLHPDLPARGDVSIRWEGTIVPAETGKHTIHTFSNNWISVWIDDQLVIEHWRQGWLPWKDVARLDLEAGRPYRIKVEWVKDQGDETIDVRWTGPARSADTSLWSEVGDGIDYYFVHGPRLDDVVAGYRKLTGTAPMMPQWAYGLWQCRQRYKTAQEVIDVLRGYRSRGIPIDNIVQDWFYWKEDSWGSHEFDPQRFPDPDRWIREIHNRYHARLMISVWPKFYPSTKNAQEMQQRGFLYQPNLVEGLKDWVGRGYVSTFYDAFNREAGELFWRQIERELLSKGIDAWWLDATEPDLTPRPTLEGQKKYAHPTAMGSGSRMLNAYSLPNSEAVYEGQRKAKPDQRVFILTRSAFAGQQRYAAAVWSGDITATWAAFRKQIPAGLSYGLTGLPYWTTDIGGFAVPPKFSRQNVRPEDFDEWCELNNRWFQFGTFNPLLRVHGEFPNREMWEFGGDDSPTYHSQLKFNRLRYRMLPYIYSMAGSITQNHDTMMRALVMDFADDANVRDIGDQFMFGPALLVSPVTTYRARMRSIYLPRGADWYDFWTGERLDGGQTIESPAPYDAIPLHVRAGSIVPFGPEIQRSGEKPADPITLFVYTGADAEFTLYEDAGLNYNYESGAFATIPFRWNEASQTLTIGKREGSFAGMLAERTFRVVFISKDKPVGFSFEPPADRAVKYTGEPIQIKWEDRVEKILSQLTVEEKVSLLHGDSKFTTAGIPRLGIPRRWLSDGPHGIREDIGPDTWDSANRTDDFATWLPVSMCLAATFDPDLANEYGQVLANEALHRGKHIVLGPAVNIQRTPLCGRNFEYMGEDPYLTSRIAVGYIQGVQSQPVAACIKHFAANNQETQRGSINVEMDDRTLHEIYLPAFKAAVTEANVLTVMGAYNRFRGEHCCHSDLLLNQILKNDWGFKGLVMSDWAGTHSTREAAQHGLDLEMGTEKPYSQYHLSGPFLEGIRRGEYPMSLLDDKARRNLHVMEKTGMFDARPQGAFNTKQHQQSARKVAEAGIVLLKNGKRALPLDAAKIRSIAVIGENAIRPLAAGGGAAGIKAFYEITPLQGLVARAGEQIDITYSTGYIQPRRGRQTTQPATAPSSDELIQRAVEAAKRADIAIVFAGYNLLRGYDTEGADRPDLRLTSNQDELIRRVVQANPRTIVVIMSGAGVAMDPWVDEVPAIVQAWYPGMEGGHAIARILFGDVNPSGKLPCTFPKSLDDSPAHAMRNYPGHDGTVRYEEGLLVGYRWFDEKRIEPLFPFGHGLSYTTFEYSNLRIAPGTPTTVEFDITNTGDREGAEVAQVYVQDVQSSLPRPIKELKGFRRVTLQPRQTTTVTIPLDRGAFSYYDPSAGDWISEPGEFILHIGSSSRDIRLKGSIQMPEIR